MSCNVLLTGINSSPALNVIRYLKRQDRYEVKIIGCDITEYTAGRMLTDQFYKIPKHDAQNLLPALLDICHREKVDIIIPIFEPEMLIISENRELFAGIKIVLPAKETVRLCLDKDKTLRFFADNYIPTCKVYEKDEVGTGAFPLFIKPRVGDSSRGTMVIRDRGTEHSLFSRGTCTVRVFGRRRVHYRYILSACGRSHLSSGTEETGNS